MGIEIWTLLALVAVLAVYVLPFLVGRREVMGRARAEDRYSGQLRVLLTQVPDASADPACLRSGHVEIFRRRPEVRTMNRPAVRNVRALRTERELARARRARAEAVARRRVAASRRATVAAVLAGLTLGTWVVTAVTTAPWPVGLVPTALLLASMVMGRQAAVAGVRADAVARRRITQLERDLRALTGETAARRGDEPAGDRAADGMSESDAAQDPGGEPARAHVVAEAGMSVAAGEATAPLADGPATVDVLVEKDNAAPVAVEIDSALAGWGGAARPRPVSGPPTPSADAAPTQGQATSRTASEPADGKPVTASVGDLGGERETTAPSTPPQGWRPVRVPAPTYTLAARAPRRAYAEIEEPGAERAVSPVRPMTALRTTPSPAEADFHPIDLDAVLERRRAAGE